MRTYRGGRRRRGKRRRDFTRYVDGDPKQVVKVLLVFVVLSVFGFSAQRLKSDNYDSQTDNSTAEYSTDLGTSITVEFIDVGQGDATLVNAGGKYMLIDTGDRDSSNTLISHLKEDGVETIDYLVLSHPHADHIGEAAEIIQTFDVLQVIAPDVPDSLVPTSVTYENLLDAMEDKGLDFHAAQNETFDFGGCIVETWAAEGDYSNVNNYSVIIKLTDGGKSFLFGGDCEKEEESEILSIDANLSATVMKAAHHGSKTSSTQQWLEAVSPEYTVISCGADNSYGHPDSDTYQRISAVCENVYVTAECGTVTFKTDGSELTCTTER